MKSSSLRLLGLPMLMGLWLALSGADQGCWVVEPDCGALDEAACLERADCRAIYTELYWTDDAPALRCLPGDGLRCVVPEPVFERCEVRPVCAGLDEGACLGEGACQAVYGYSEDWYLLDGPGTRCGGARCIEPPETFIECVEAGSDYCQGLDETECQRRVGCEAEYDWPGCYDREGETLCWDGMPNYRGCRLAGGGECRTDWDCYAFYGPGDDGAPRPGCEDFYFTCEQGRCVEHCQEPVGCRDDSECDAGERCEIRCGNGWCQGACVPAEEDCQVTGCPAGQVCEVMCWDCAPGTDCEGGCTARCVPDQPTCFGDQDCPEGMYCAGDFCDPAQCGGVCLPLETQGCGGDAECAPGERCEVHCGFGLCRGECVPAGEPVWFQFEPMQCVETPWEADQARQPEAYLHCMVDCGPDRDCGLGFEEICRVQTFLALQGVPALDLRNVHYPYAVCQACGVCPRGNVVYALVDSAFAEFMLRLGFLPY